MTKLSCLVSLLSEECLCLSNLGILKQCIALVLHIRRFCIGSIDVLTAVLGFQMNCSSRKPLRLPANAIVVQLGILDFPE